MAIDVKWYVIYKTLLDFFLKIVKLAQSKDGTRQRTKLLRLLFFWRPRRIWT